MIFWNPTFLFWFISEYIPRIIGHGKHQEWNLMNFYIDLWIQSHIFYIILLCWSQLYASLHSNMNQIVCSKLLTIQINHPQWRGELLHKIMKMVPVDGFMCPLLLVNLGIYQVITMIHGGF